MHISGIRRPPILKYAILQYAIQDTVVDPSEYCRQVEAHLCRKNEGHLVRIVGPAFEKVCGWAASGVPLKIAVGGVDRYCERYYAKGPRRRPVRIEHCEADVLDLFDHWRRVVGVPASVEPEARDAGEREGPSRREGLPRHVERVLRRLTELRAGWPLPDELAAAVDNLIDALDAGRGELRALRGEARVKLLEWLAAQDRRLLDAARAICDPAVLAAFEREAEQELQAFRTRMTGDAWDRAVSAAVDRLVREHSGLPSVAFD